MNRKNLVGLAACALLALPARAQPAGAQGFATDADRLEASADHLARMRVALKQALARVEDARQEKDVVKLNCVNEKLTQMKALLKVAEQADVALHEAVTARHPAAEAELSKVAIARAKIDALRGQADRCVGQLAFVVEEKTTVEVQAPPDLPGEGEGPSGVDARHRGPPFPVPPVVRPPPASPYGASP